ncbi:MAG: hypothetical protein ACAI38_15410 [Myxococcota bacterium]|nr:hypothetical protein [Myxococcota bacterium]
MQPRGLALGSTGEARYVAPLQAGLPTDGGAVLDRIITELGAARGPRAIVWDIDGTIVETRKRMLAALHAYGRTATLAQLRDTAPHTDDVIRDFGLDQRRFEIVWDRVFWQADRLGDDVPIRAIVERMQRAARLGIQNIILTGRNTELGPATRTFLNDHEIPFTLLLCKQNGQLTVPFKSDKVAGLLARFRVGAFVTDAAREIAGIQRTLGSHAPTSVVVAAAGGPIRDAAGIAAHVLPVELAG